MSLNPLDYVWDFAAMAAALSACAVMVNAYIAHIALKASRDRTEEEFAVAWTDKVISWAGDASDSLSAIEHVIRCVGSPEEKDHREKFASLSSLIDRGRLLFENDRSDDYGDHKPRAYKGYRPVLLDSLVDVYDRFEEFFAGDTNQVTAGNSVRVNIANEIRHDRQNFISEVQSIVNPFWFHTKATKFNREVNNA